MKFNATSWVERNYKIIAAICVVFATAGCCIWFFETKDKDGVMYFAPIIYALILYLIGIFTNRISDNISASLPQKAETYKNLKRVEELLSAIIKKEDGLKGIRSNIFLTKAFTGHTGDDNIDKKPYIKENGFKLEASYLKIEQEYVDLFEQIIKYLDERIRKYVDTNKISSITPFFHVDESTIFESDEWCKTTFEENTDVLNFLYSTFEELEFDKLDSLISQIQKCEEHYYQLCKKSIHQIEAMYGNKLTDYLEQEQWHYSDIDYIREIIADVESNLSQQIESSNEEISNISGDCNDIKQQIDQLFNLIDE